MRAVMLREPGSAEVLTVEEVPEPVPAPGEVVVDVVGRDTQSSVNCLRPGWRPVVDSTFPPDEVADAHRRMEAQLHFGKIVLSIT